MMWSDQFVASFPRSYSFPGLSEFPKSSKNKASNDGYRLIAAGLFFIISAFFSSPAYAVDVTLGWDPNSEPDVEGYGVYFSQGDTGPPYNLFGYVTLTELNDPGSPFFTVTGLEKGSRYYFAVTAYDSSGNESAFSNSVCADIGDAITACPSSVSGGDSGSAGASSGGGSGGGGGCFIGSSAACYDRSDSGMSVIAAVVCMAAVACMGRSYFKRSLAMLKRKIENDTFHR